MGSVGLGTFTSPRNLTRIVDPNLNPDAPRVPVLILSGIGNGGLLVFGNITLGDTNGVQNQNFIHVGGGVVGNFDGTGSAGVINISLEDLLIGSPVWNAPTGALSALSCTWIGGTPSFDHFVSCVHCVFQTGFTVASDPNSVVITDTEVFGTVTSPTNPIVDYFTNGIFAANAVVKAGGWAATVPFGQTVAY
jgi:hypothetical protein